MKREIKTLEDKYERHNNNDNDASCNFLSVVSDFNVFSAIKVVYYH